MRGIVHGHTSRSDHFCSVFLAQLLDMIFLSEIRQTTGNFIVYANYVMLYCSNLYEAKKGCLQCEGVKNSLSDAIKKAITREELSRHCKDTWGSWDLNTIKRLILDMSGRMDSEGNLLFSVKISTTFEQEQKHIAGIQDPEGLPCSYTITGHITKS